MHTIPFRSLSMKFTNESIKDTIIKHQTTVIMHIQTIFNNTELYLIINCVHVLQDTRPKQRFTFALKREKWRYSHITSHMKPARKHSAQYIKTITLMMLEHQACVLHVGLYHKENYPTFGHVSVYMYNVSLTYNCNYDHAIASNNSKKTMLTMSEVHQM